MKRSGDSTHLCRSPTPTMDGCDLTPPTQTQTSEQEYSDLTANNKRQSTQYSRNTSQSFSRGTRCMLSRGRKNMCRRLWCTPMISRKFTGEWKFGL